MTRRSNFCDKFDKVMKEFKEEHMLTEGDMYLLSMTYLIQIVGKEMKTTM